MALSDEIAKLHDLRAKGVITEAEFEQAKARLLAGESEGPGAKLGINRLRRSNSDQWLAGVCGGLARLTGIQSWIWRLAFVGGTLFAGLTALIYLLLWVLVPRAEHDQQ
jgi:phage shock protein PspC (stress-responsive transcriptional regulator)